MIKEYLKSLKTSGNFSWQDISKASGLPEVTIRKIFSGETEDPRFETVARIVRAMGGSLDKVNELNQIEKAIEEDPKAESLAAVKEVYEARIKEIKASADVQVSSLKKERKIIAIVAGVLGVALLSVLFIDFLMGSAGWIRY